MGNLEMEELHNIQEEVPQKPVKKLFDIELTDEEFDKLICEQEKGKLLKVVDGKVVAVERVITEEKKLQIRIAELKGLLESTDYQAIKFAENELTAEEYEPMRLQRKAWREEIRSLGG
jgi:FtsZ-binding cell division protein ZapB